MNAELLKKQERKYGLIALFIAVFLHLLIIFGFWLADRLFPEELSTGEGPVMIRLGRPEGTAEESLVENLQEETAPAPEQEIEKTESLPEKEEIPSVIKKEIVGEKIAPEKKDSVPAVEKTPEPAKPVVKFSSETTPSVETAQAEKKEAVSEIIKGEEQGNSFEYNFSGGNGKIGRNLYIPIALYMPLPWSVDTSLIAAITKDIHGFFTAEERRAELLKYYEQDGSRYRKKDSVALDIRPELWVILEDAGYDLEKAEYKQGRNLRDIQLSFTVLEKGGSLEGIQVDKSSGYSEIDEAVVYGFTKSTYYNAAGFDVKGRFTYRF